MKTSIVDPPRFRRFSIVQTNDNIEKIDRISGYMTSWNI